MSMVYKVYFKPQKKVQCPKSIRKLIVEEEEILITKKYLITSKCFMKHSLKTKKTLIKKVKLKSKNSFNL